MANPTPPDPKTEEPSPGPVEEADPKSLIDLSLNPDETGQIMVLMYHQIGAEEATWVRTPEAFREDLQTLYDQGFRPISLSDYVSGNITTQAGMTPFVLTFDDGRMNNFKWLEDGSIDPECAVGILVDFNKSHPDFPLEATFFLTGSNPFGQQKLVKEKLKQLLDLGMDVGNHTVNHPNFSKITDAATVQMEIGQQAQFIESLIDQDYTVNTLALTYGSRPKDDALKAYLVEGSYHDVAYRNIVLLNVGSNPGDSPYTTRFDATNVPRVRASQLDTAGVGLYDYLAAYEKNPQRRFISDGNPDLVTVPQASADKLKPDLEKETYVY